MTRLVLGARSAFAAGVAGAPDVDLAAVPDVALRGRAAQLVARLGVNPAFFQGTRFPNAAQQPVEQAAGRVPAGYVYRLPTEAEREHCCRSGTSTPDMTDGFRVVLAPALP